MLSFVGGAFSGSDRRLKGDIGFPMLSAIETAICH
jgi:hypothetical protein